MGKLYVGNLPYKLDEEELKGHFEKVGEVTSAKIIVDRDTERSKGFGFIEMADSDLSQAIEELDGAELMGRPLKVAEAKPQQKRDSNRGGNRDKFSNSMNFNNNRY